MSRINSRILFAAGPISEQGGPAKYSRELTRTLTERGYIVHVVHYALFRIGVPGIRQVAYCIRLLVAARNADAIMAFDTWSLGLPAYVVAKLWGIPLLLRVGGDILWERNIERTNSAILLSEFYSSKPQFSFAERLIHAGTRILLQGVSLVAFNTEWQKNIWKEAYGLSESQTRVLENVYPPRIETKIAREPIFVSAGRAIRLKNTDLVKQVFSNFQKSHPNFTLDTDVLSKEAHADRIRTCQAVLLASLSDIAPNTIIEAAAAGTPFMCTTDTGIKDRLSGCGVFVDTRNPAAIAAALEQLSDPSTYRTFQENIAQTYQVRDWAAVTDDLAYILSELGLQPVPVPGGSIS